MDRKRACVTQRAIQNTKIPDWVTNTVDCSNANPVRPPQATPIHNTVRCRYNVHRFAVLTSPRRMGSQTTMRYKIFSNRFIKLHRICGGLKNAITNN